MSETGIYLDSLLAPLAPWLERPDVTDIYVNRPGELWVESLGGEIETHAVQALTEPVLMRLARQIAARTAQGISRAWPAVRRSGRVNRRAKSRRAADARG